MLRMLLNYRCHIKLLDGMNECKTLEAMLNTNCGSCVESEINDFLIYLILSSNACSSRTCYILNFC